MYLFVESSSETKHYATLHNPTTLVAWTLITLFSKNSENFKLNIHVSTL